MAKFWREPLDTTQHEDHFVRGQPVTSKAPARGPAWMYFVEVAGFTFELATLDQLRECLRWFETPLHGSSHRPVFEPEKGHWEAWHERLPAHICKRSKRARVIKALRTALRAFVTDAA
jgi:hypothetical protein